MEAELSRRLAIVVNFIPFNERQAFVARVAKAKTFSDLSTEDQDIITSIEESL